MREKSCPTVKRAASAAQTAARTRRPDRPNRAQPVHPAVQDSPADDRNRHVTGRAAIMTVAAAGLGYAISIGDHTLLPSNLRVVGGEVRSGHTDVAAGERAAAPDGSGARDRVDDRPRTLEPGCGRAVDAVGAETAWARATFIGRWRRRAGPVAKSSQRCSFHERISRSDRPGLLFVSPRRVADRRGVTDIFAVFASRSSRVAHVEKP